MFKLFDKDESGEISTDELRHVLAPNSSRLKDADIEVWNKILGEVDYNGNG